MKKRKYAWFEVQNEVHRPIETLYEEDHWFELYLQKGIYHYPSGITEIGYRFIRRRPDGKLQYARNQACIPSPGMAQELIDEAKKAGWASDLSPEDRYGTEGSE